MVSEHTHAPARATKPLAVASHDRMTRRWLKKDGSLQKTLDSFYDRLPQSSRRAATRMSYRV
jgi:hypothetical protein